MHPKICTRRLHNAAVILTALVFALSGIAVAADTGRIIPTGKVSVYHQDNKVDELRNEAPLPYDSLLVCQSKCAVRNGTLFFAAGDGASFSVSAPPQNNLVQFLEGKFYFSITDLPAPLVIKTPLEDITVQQVIFNAAAAGSKLDGYLFVEPGSVEIGVLEGGSMIISTSQLEQTIATGKKITIAQNDDSEPVAAATGGEGAAQAGISKKTMIIGGAIGAAAIIAVAALAGGGGGGGDDSPPDVSRYQP